jgi:hypothetical protein
MDFDPLSYIRQQLRDIFSKFQIDCAIACSVSSIRLSESLRVAERVPFQCQTQLFSTWTKSQQGLVKTS